MALRAPSRTRCCFLRVRVQPCALCAHLRARSCRVCVCVRVRVRVCVRVCVRLCASV